MSRELTMGACLILALGLFAGCSQQTNVAPPIAAPPTSNISTTAALNNPAVSPAMKAAIRRQASP